MTRNELLARYPHASESFIRDNTSEHSRQSTVAEHAPVSKRSAKDKDQASNSGKVRIRIVDVRERLLDPDNPVPKYHIDCLRYAGLIQFDTPDKVTLETSQRLVRTGEVPHTEMTLEPL